MSSYPSIWSLCKQGFRTNRIPALVLQGFAALFLAAYFLTPSLRPAFDAVSGFKQRTDPWFAICTTAVFGGVIPWAVSWFRGRIPSGRAAVHFLGMLGYWSFTGALIDWFYAMQAEWFGSGRDIHTLALKTLIDQGPFNLLWATPACLLFYGWKESDFSWRRFRDTHPWPVVKQKYATIQISCWIVWIPAVMMIYALPLGLQQPLFNLVICFFSLLLLVINR